MSDEILTWPVSRIAREIRARRVSSEEVVGSFLDRIGTVNPELNAVVELQPDAALERAREADRAIASGAEPGPLHGVPMTVKDSFDTAELVTTGGTTGLASHVPEANATVVQRLVDAGAVVLGKTNTPELTFAYETDNLVYGRTVHPADPARTPGGSSGGATAILAACGSPLDVGSDTGGSIRVPSHFCGTAGLKPTVGAVPRTGHLVSFEGLFQSLTQIGPLGRYVEDLALTLPLIEGPDWRDPHVSPRPEVPWGGTVEGLRVALYTDNGIMAAEPDVADAVRDAGTALEEAGAHVEEDCPPGIERSLDLLYGLFGADGGAGVRGFLEMLGTERLSPLIDDLLELLEDRATSLPEFELRAAEWDEWRSGMLAWLADYDVVVCPPCAFPAPLHGTTNDDDRLPGFTHASAYNLTGWPAAVVRVGSSEEGLPIGAQVVGRPWCEGTCLTVAGHLESALGGWRPIGL